MGSSSYPPLTNALIWLTKFCGLSHACAVVSGTVKENGQVSVDLPVAYMKRVHLSLRQAVPIADQRQAPLHA
jgi:hypothetical protein